MARPALTLARVDRAAILSRALKGWPRITKLCKHKERGGLTFQVNGEHPYIHTIDVDRKTGIAAMKIVEQFIRAELTGLGVKLPAKRKR